MGKNLWQTFVHIVATAVIPPALIITMWFTHSYLLPRFPLTGLEMVTFRVVEVALHLAMLRQVFRLVVPKDKTKPRGWWL